MTPRKGSAMRATPTQWDRESNTIDDDNFEEEDARLPHR